MQRFSDPRPKPKLRSNIALASKTASRSHAQLANAKKPPPPPPLPLIRLSAIAMTNPQNFASTFNSEYNDSKKNEHASFFKL